MRRRLDPKLGYSRWHCSAGHKHVSEQRARECERRPDARRSARQLFGPLQVPAPLPDKRELCDMCSAAAVVRTGEIESHLYCARHAIEAAERAKERRIRK